jgi:hypothetical protein
MTHQTAMKEMTLKIRMLCLLVTMALAGCGCGAARGPGSDPGPGPGTEGERPAVEPSEAPAGETASWNGLVPMASIEGLPVSMPTPGYPGNGFRVGVFDSPDAWQRFATAARVEGFPGREIDWIRQRVAYVILDAQTNSLAFNRLGRDGSSGVIVVDWDGIEPFYEDATPAVLVLVDVRNLEQLRFEVSAAEGESPTVLGTIPVSVE